LEVLKNSLDNGIQVKSKLDFQNGVKVVKSTRFGFWRLEHRGKINGGAEATPNQ
jgi:hypothetical protein